MATGRERPKVTRHTMPWMGSNNLRFRCRNCSLHKSRQVIKGSVSLCGSIPNDCKLQSQEVFLDLEENIVYTFWWSCFTQLVGGRFFCLCESLNCGSNESRCLYLWFSYAIETEILFLFKARLLHYILDFSCVCSGCGDLHILLNEYSVWKSLWGTTYVSWDSHKNFLIIQ